MGWLTVSPIIGVPPGALFEAMHALQHEQVFGARPEAAVGLEWRILPCDFMGGPTFKQCSVSLCMRINRK
jgi:hypothetical protein